MPSIKSYSVNMGLVALVYSLAILGSRWLLNAEQNLGAVMAILIAAAPILPALWGVRTVVVYVRGLDELETRQSLQALTYSALTVGVLSFTYGLIEGMPGVPHIGMVFVFPALIGIYGIALPFVRRAYQ